MERSSGRLGCWNEYGPIHVAVREGHAEVAQLPLQAGADPSQSCYTYNSRDKRVWSVVVTSVVLSESGYRRCRQRRPR